VFWSFPGNRYALLDHSLRNRYPAPVSQFLIFCGASPNARDYSPNVSAPMEPEHPLVRAVYMDDPEMVRYLVTHGSNVNFLWGEGFSPLWIAVERNNVEIVRLLLEHGADPDFKTIFDKSPRMLAESSGNSKMLTLFQERKTAPAKP
jgi:ankyrin repeat protein